MLLLGSWGLPRACGVLTRRVAVGAASALVLKRLAPAERAFATGATQYSRVEDLLAYVEQYAERNNITSVIETMDSYSSPDGENKIDGWGRWMMSVGGEKGGILEGLVREQQPRAVLEVGTFCGYSAMRMLRALPEDALFVTIEKDPRTAAVARSLLTFAGVDMDRIELVVGSSADELARIKQRHRMPFDFVLLDHWKPEYAPDLRRLEKLRMLRTGSVVVADNIVCPGAPALLEYLNVAPWPGWDLECDPEFPLTRSERRDEYVSRHWRTRLVDCSFEYRPEQPDAMSVSVYTQ